MRTVALDVHKRFAEVAVHENGGLRRLGRIETRPASPHSLKVTAFQPHPCSVTASRSGSLISLERNL
jgi:hypothetical protein